jgi:hypothetical protein
MADASLFDLVADALEARAGLDALATRGTLRLALKSAGLDPKTVTREQMHVVLERVLPRELESRGVVGPDEVCKALADVVRRTHAETGGPRDAAPEDVFRRMRERAAS